LTVESSWHFLQLFVGELLMVCRYFFPVCVVLTVCLFAPALALAQGSLSDFLISRVKASTYCGKQKLGDLLPRYCDKESWQYDKADDVLIYRARVKKNGAALVVRFRIVEERIGDEKTGKSRLVVISPDATLGGKKAPDWQDKVFEKEYLATADVKIATAQASPFYRWKVGDLLGKYCNQPVWSFNKETDRVQFRGRLKKGGQELAVWFQVAYAPIDKSNSATAWQTLDSGATLAGKEAATGSLWQGRVFVEEERQMRAGKDEK
jgi:hypothetical protein